MIEIPKKHTEKNQTVKNICIWVSLFEIIMSILCDIYARSFKCYTKNEHTHNKDIYLIALFCSIAIFTTLLSRLRYTFLLLSQVNVL